ncbi:hypothetical protein GCM10010517_47650 [Streptosporangium fragile]|uniref:Uncharacterized protein n=1 Tax=Streptosporangium fragile TaxID=46186 RepID=A0ABN3W209_9ACTN
MVKAPSRFPPGLSRVPALSGGGAEGSLTPVGTPVKRRQALSRNFSQVIRGAVGAPTFIDRHGDSGISVMWSESGCYWDEGGLQGGSPTKVSSTTEQTTIWSYL